MTQDFQGTPFRPLTPDELSQMQGVRAALLQQPGAQLQETQAAAGAAGASAGLSSQETANAQLTQQELAIKLQQAQSSKALRADLQNKMTLPHAMSKYTALGMNPNDVFSQYLSESPWGTPNESPEDLQKMGVSGDALGKIGTPGSFMDRYNTKNALVELRGLEDTFNHTTLLSHVPFLGDQAASAKAYNAQKQIVGEHLSSLVPGASNSQGSNQGFLNNLPDPSNPFDISAASGQFSKTEQALLQSKGYSLKDLGLTPRNRQQNNDNNNQPSIPGFLQNVGTSGKDLLNNLLNLPLEQGKKLAADIQSGNAQQTFNDSNPSMLLMNFLKGYGQNLYKDAGSPLQGGDIVGRILGNAYKNPIGVAVDALPFLSALKAGSLADGATMSSEGGVDAIAQSGGADAFSKAPGALEKYLTPGKAQRSIGAIRDNVISSADKSGATIKGKDLASGIRQWADQAKMSNLPDANAIEEAATTAEKRYAGKNFKPSDLKNIYDDIEKGYTKGGEPRSATASYIDRGVKKVISQQLDRVTENNFSKTSDLFSQAYDAKESPVRKIAGRAVGVGLGLGGLDAVRHILGL